MLKKLIKYDLKFLFTWSRYLWIIAFSSAISLIVLCALGAGHYPGLFDFFAALAMLALVFFNFISPIFVYVRYYKCVATDEAYLTFTLPVSRKTFLISKTILTLIEAFARYLFLGLTFLLCAVFVPSFDEPGAFTITQIFANIQSSISSAFSDLGVWLILYVLLAILGLAIITVLISCVIYLAITIGANVAQKSKLLVTIGVLFAFYFVSSYVLPILYLTAGFTVLAPLVEMITALPYTLMLAAWFVAGLLLCTVLAAITAIIYFINLGILERKLNLQ